jgi:hypothetical protein
MADNLTNWQNAATDRFDYGKAAYQEAIPALGTANAAAEQAAGFQGSQASMQGDMAKYLAGRTKTFAGMQDIYAGKAFDTNSAAEQARVTGQAGADVASKFDSLRAQSMRESARRGVNPSSGRSMAMSNQLNIAEAAASAGAMSKARTDLSLLADDRQKTAIGFGANLPSQSNSAAQTAGVMADKVVANAAAPLTNRLNFAGGISSIYGNAANNYGDVWKSTNLTPGQQAVADQQGNSNNLSAIGAIAGSNWGGKLIDKGISYLFG